MSVCPLSPTDFEKQVGRIIKLVEGEGSKVTWNDHLPDPDNQRQSRQIDISIVRDNALTIVECRQHKAPQNVTWIEELIGRRQSLQADAVIAVSSSGFSEGAVRKAARFGVILRQMQELDDYEVRLWGKKTRVNFNVFEFTNTKVCFGLDTDSVSVSPKITGSDGRPIDWKRFFHALLPELSEMQGLEAGRQFWANMQTPGMLVDELPPTSTKITGRVRRFVQEHNLASVVAYHPPSNLESSVFVERREGSKSEVIQHRDRVATIVDVSSVKIPENHIIYTFQIDFGRIVTLVDINFIGLKKWANIDTNIQVEVNALRY